MSLCILIPAIVGIISAILGYLLGSRFNSNSGDNNLSLQSDLDNCRANSKKLSDRIATLESDLAASKSEKTATVQNFASNIVAIPFDGEAAFVAMGKKWKQDDLKIVEGIGPKIEELYHNAGIKTWLQLSETAVETSQNILNGGGDAYKVHNPSTWAKQALLAYQGKWQELKDWQNALDGGKE